MDGIASVEWRKGGTDVDVEVAPSKVHTYIYLWKAQAGYDQLGKRTLLEHIHLEQLRSSVFSFPVTGNCLRNFVLHVKMNCVVFIPPLGRYPLPYTRLIIHGGYLFTADINTLHVKYDRNLSF